MSNFNIGTFYLTTKQKLVNDNAMLLQEAMDCSGIVQRLFPIAVR